MPRSKATSTTDRPPAAVPSFRFVGGKGGVGKTTCAAALAISTARAGHRTLIVSTDPAPSLGDALRQPLGAVPRRVTGQPRLDAVEIDAPAALEAWIAARRGLLEEIAVRGTWLDRDDVTRLLRLSLPGIDEIAALLQLADFSASGKYDCLIVDTAPTGHMLRMLAMPTLLGGIARAFDRMQGKHRIMVEAIRGGWTGDAADALIDSIDSQARRMDAILRDATASRLAWVTLPELMAVEETRDALMALRDDGMTVDRMVVNRVTQPPPQRCSWCSARRRGEWHAMRRLQKDVPAAPPMTWLPAMEVEPRGLRPLALIGRLLDRPARMPRAPGAASARSVLVAASSFVDRGRAPVLAAAGTRLLMFGGKGGVGKTTCAAAVAVRTASERRRSRVLLLSTDPAHSLGDVFGAPVSDQARAIEGGPVNLLVREIDAQRGFSELRTRFAAAIDALVGRIAGAPGLGGEATRHDRQVLQDLFDLAPPGVDELIAVMEVTDAILGSGGEPQFDLVVVDSAPTGHALRLLEMPGLAHDWVKALMAILLKYQPVVGVGELAEVLLRLSQGLRRLRELLADPLRTTFVAVTRAAALPREETVRLIRRLRAASISVPAVVVNAAGAGTCTRCAREARMQQRELRALARELVGRHGALLVIVAPAWMPPPAGHAGLRRFFAQWRQQPQAPPLRRR
jgi:arsenite-transporting ATPase